MALAGVERRIDVDAAAVVDAAVVQTSQDVQVVGQNDSASRLRGRDYCAVNVNRSATGGLVET